MKEWKRKMDQEQKAVLLCEEYRRSGYACSESVARALADVFCLSFSAETYKVISVFAGGAAEDGRCGVLEAGLLVMANLYTLGKIRPGQSLEELSIELHGKFQERYGSYLCSGIFYPLYETHQKSGEKEEDFSCAFHEGISIITRFLITKLTERKRQ